MQFHQILLGQAAGGKSGCQNAYVPLAYILDEMLALAGQVAFLGD